MSINVTSTENFFIIHIFLIKLLFHKFFLQKYSLLRKFFQNACKWSFEDDDWGVSFEGQKSKNFQQRQLHLTISYLLKEAYMVQFLQRVIYIILWKLLVPNFLCACPIMHPWVVRSWSYMNMTLQKAGVVAASIFVQKTYVIGWYPRVQVRMFYSCCETFSITGFCQPQPIYCNLFESAKKASWSPQKEKFHTRACT